jgi:3-isopropylmalate dehydrogenase
MDDDSSKIVADEAAGARLSLTPAIGPAWGACDKSRTHVIGVLEGEGVGPEVVPVALRLLAVLGEHTDRRFELRFGGPIGLPAKALSGKSLSADVERFAGEVFDAGGALFCGPGGDRFVYELRRAFGLFCKFTPLQPLPELARAGAVRGRITAGVDIIAVRENMGGLYQGDWSTEVADDGLTTASHRFAYTDRDVGAILTVAFRLAAARRRRLHLVLKPAGAPSISRLWRGCAEAIGAGFDVELFEQEIDNAVYQLIADPQQFDVIVSPNMFGDVIADCGSLLLASRGLSYSGNFSVRGQAAYQTGHGAARDIAGRDLANPIGQIMALAMMLRESFAWPAASAAVVRAVRTALAGGGATADIVTPHHRSLGTRAFGEAVEAALRRLLAGESL